MSLNFKDMPNWNRYVEEQKEKLNSKKFITHSETLPPLNNEPQEETDNNVECQEIPI